ncbi:MAG: hypothetical protein FWH11_11730 [Micrococcales bacterium]|nr:hypothetical protein [Micrococcales bacterium]
MSISLILVPLALAGVGAVAARRQGEGTQVQVQTRMKNEDLLADALRDTQARVVRSADGIVADWHQTRAEFHRDDQGIWVVDFTGEVDRASQIVGAVDAAYGRRVQQSVLSRLRQQAPAAGLSIASETVEADDSVTLVLDLVEA